MPAENSIAVVQGSATVTGTLTGFVGAEWDLFLARGRAIPVERVVSTSEILLKSPWPDASVAEIPREQWAIGAYGPYWSSSVTVNARITELLDKMRRGLPLKFDASGPISSRPTYDNQPAGFVFLSTEVPFALYVKESSANASSSWSGGSPIEPTPAQTTAEAEAAAATALAARNVTTAARDVAVSARDVSLAARDVSTAARDTATDKAAIAVAKADVATAQATIAIDRAAASEASRQASETARAGSEMAQAGLSVARDAAVAAASQAQTHRIAAQSSATAAADRAAAAETSRAAAVTARTGAEAAYASTAGLYGSAQALSDAVGAAQGLRNATAIDRQAVETARAVTEDARDLAQLAASNASAVTGIPLFDTPGTPLVVKDDLSGLTFSRRARIMALVALAPRF